MSLHLLLGMRLILIQGESNNDKSLPTIILLRFELSILYWVGTLRLKFVISWVNNCWCVTHKLRQVTTKKVPLYLKNAKDRKVLFVISYCRDNVAASYIPFPIGVPCPSGVHVPLSLPSCVLWEYLGNLNSHPF